MHYNSETVILLGNKFILNHSNTKIYNVLQFGSNLHNTVY